MTETTTEQAPPPPPPPPPRPPAPPLLRPPHDRVFRGVCAAIGRSTGTDPVLWRVLVVVLAVFGGSGIVLYLAGWLLIPEEGAERSELQRLLSRDGSRSLLTLALVAVVVVLVLVAFGGDALGLVPALVVGVIVWLVLRERQAAPAVDGWTSAPGWTTPPPAATASGYGPVHGPPPPPPAPRPRSNLGALTVSAVGLAVGVLLLAGALGLDGVTAPRVVAVALLVTGAGLVVGARWGRSRGLIALAVALAILLAMTSALDRALGADTGERTWVVGGSAVRELGAGTATLDLRPLSGTTEREVAVEARVGGGELLVLVPDDVRVALDADVGAGEYRLTGTGPRRDESGFALDDRVLFGPADGPLVTLTVDVGVGELEVRRVDTP